MAVKTTVQKQCDNEAAPLLLKKTSSSWLSRYVRRYKTTRKCVSSKSALLILFWIFILDLWNGVALNPDLYLRNFPTIFTLASYGFVALVYCFFPVAGFLADVKYGRHKVVVGSLSVFLVSVPPCMFTIWGILSFEFLSTDSCSIACIFVVVLSLIVLLLSLVASYVGIVGFTANVVQFGLDQLHDSPGEDQTLFIHWCQWVYAVAIVISQLAVQIPFSSALPTQTPKINLGWYNLVGSVLLGSIPVFVLISLIVTLCLAKRRRNWFLIEPGTVNPYKLVYRVTKFARQHKTPVRRSAFTYCEDEIPTGLDLGKEKYGGPFSTEQVEDVKVFYGILKVLFSFGAVFFLDFAANSVLPFYTSHIVASEFETLPEQILLNCGLLSPLLIAICLPLYLCLLRPFISRYVPGMLRRMGLGMVLSLLSLMVLFATDVTSHMHPRGDRNEELCMFQDPSELHYEQSPLLLIVPLVLTSLSHILIYTAVFEFICSQSPHSMKGLLIGLLYAIKGLYQLLATLFVVPFAVGYTSHPSHVGQMSCGFWYYSAHVAVGLIAVLAYVWVAEKYKYRERDEICDVHRYAEEYYSNPQPEQYPESFFVQYSTRALLGTTNL